MRILEWNSKGHSSKIEKRDFRNPFIPSHTKSRGVINPWIVGIYNS